MAHDERGTAMELYDCEQCGETYDEETGEGYCGLCPECGDAETVALS